ncbi:MAG: alpha/beta fold hydrolase [Bacteroidota bacterium]
MRRLIYLLVALLTSSCMDFRYSANEMNDFLSQHSNLKSDTLTVDGQQIHYVYSNSHRNNLIVFVHGSPGSWNAFSRYMTTDSLFGKYDMLSVDRPGFGYSDYGTAEPSIKNQAYLISEVIKKFDNPTKILVGHSLGGPVIARIAMDFPALVQGLLFLAPSIDPEMEKFEWYRALGKTWVGDLVTPTDFWVSNEEIIGLKAELEKMLPLWRNIHIPCLVIHGTKDSFVPVENADFAKRMIADSLIQVNYLEGERHFIPWSHPSVVVEGINQLIVETQSGL